MLKFQLAALGRALLAALALGAPAAADPPHSRAGTTFRDWRLDCAAGPCAIRTVLRGGDGSTLVVMTTTEDGLALRTPLPLFLPDGASIGLGDDPPLPLAWRTCDPLGCRADAPLDAALLDALRRESAADVSLTLVEGVRVRVAVSLIGFTAARAALEARVSP